VTGTVREGERVVDWLALRVVVKDLVRIDEFSIALEVVDSW
jgi:hypothetical protein